MDLILSKIANLVSADRRTECHRISNQFGRFIEQLLKINSKEEEKQFVQTKVNEAVNAILAENFDEKYEKESIILLLMYIKQCYPEMLDTQLTSKDWDLIAAKVSCLANTHSPSTQLTFTYFMNSAVNQVTSFDLFFSNIILKLCKVSTLPLITCSALKLSSHLKDDLQAQLKLHLIQLLRHSDQTVKRNAWRAMLNINLDVDDVELLEKYIFDIRELDVLDAAIEFVRLKKISINEKLFAHFGELLNYLIQEDLARFHSKLTMKLFKILADHKDVIKDCLKLLFENTRKVNNIGFTSLLTSLSSLAEWKCEEFTFWQKRIIKSLLSSEDLNLQYAAIEILKKSSIECLHDTEIQNLLNQLINVNDEHVQFAALTLILEHSSDGDALKVMDCGLKVARGATEEYRLKYVMKLAQLIPHVNEDRILDLIKLFPIDWTDWESCTEFANQLSKVERANLPYRLQYIVCAESVPENIRKCFDCETRKIEESDIMIDPFSPFISDSEQVNDTLEYSSNENVDVVDTAIFQDLFSHK